MKAKVDVITLGVVDLEKSLAFYRDGLGWPTQGIIGTEYQDPLSQAAGAIATFALHNGLILALYPRADLAKDAGQPLGPASATEFSLGHFVSNKAEVEALMSRAKAAGATITDAPRERPWGIFSGYFRDLDGHLWEVIWNPEATGEEGRSE